jgi:hypothetical protein
MTYKVNLTITLNDTHVIVEGRKAMKLEAVVLTRDDDLKSKLADTVLDFGTPSTERKPNANPA